MRRVIICTLFFCLFGCSSLEERFDYQRELNQVQKRWVEAVCEEFGLSVWGFSFGAFDEIEDVVMHFQTRGQSVDIDQARNMLVNAREAIVAALNNNKKLRPYLRWYPFPSEEVEISIHFFDSKESPVLEGYISSVYSHKETIFYSQTKPGKFKIEDVTEEPYDEALARVKAEGVLTLPAEFMGG